MIINKNRRLFVLIVILAGVTFCTYISLVDYRLIFSGSIPSGLWRVVDAPISVGQYIEFCPVAEQTSRQLAKVRGCDYRPIIKTVLAIAGDSVRIDQSGLSVNGFAIPSSDRLAGYRGHQVKLGEYTVQPGQVWLFSGHHPASLDSRYYGPVRRDRVIGRAEPVLIR